MTENEAHVSEAALLCDLHHIQQHFAKYSFFHISFFPTFLHLTHFPVVLYFSNAVVHSSNDLLILEFCFFFACLFVFTNASVHCSNGLKDLLFARITDNF